MELNAGQKEHIDFIIESIIEYEKSDPKNFLEGLLKVAHGGYDENHHNFGLFWNFMGYMNLNLHYDITDLGEIRCYILNEIHKKFSKPLKNNPFDLQKLQKFAKDQFGTDSKSWGHESDRNSSINIMKAIYSRNYSEINEITITSKLKLAFFYTCRFGDAKLAQNILKKIDNPASLSDFFETAFICGNLEVATFLVNKNLINLTDSKYLWLACQMGHHETVNFLLSKSNPTVVNTPYVKKDNTPLWIASQNGYTKTVRILLENKADTETKCADGFSPLHIACDNNYPSIIKLLIENNADTNIPFNLGINTPLFVACITDDFNFAKWLLEDRKVNANECRYDGISPLILCSQEGHLRIVELLLEHNANVDVRHPIDNSTPFLIAAIEGNTEIAKLLYKKNSTKHKNIPNNNGYSPLMFCASNNKLLETAHDIMHTDEQKPSIMNNTLHETPLHIAIENKQGAAVDFILNALETKQNTLTPASLAFINTKNQQGKTALMLACELGSKCNLVQLLNRGADYNIPYMQVKSIKSTVLFIACKYKYVEISGILVQHIIQDKSASTQDRINKLTECLYNYAYTHQQREPCEKINKIVTLLEEGIKELPMQKPSTFSS